MINVLRFAEALVRVLSQDVNACKLGKIVINILRMIFSPTVDGNACKFGSGCYT